MSAVTWWTQRENARVNRQRRVLADLTSFAVFVALLALFLFLRTA